jgi:hypothetical protein
MQTSIPAGVLSLIVLSAAASSAIAGGTATIVREAVELASRRSGRKLAEQATRESAHTVVESAVRRYGPKAADAFADGGLELIEAGTRYGDDVVRLAVTSGPAARRALALDPGNLVPLVRELGPEALEIEAKSPGLARTVFVQFGPDGARRLATAVPAEDMPRLIAYADRADTPQTRKLLLEAYEKEGPGLFARIPPNLVLAGGVTTAMIYGTHRLTAPVAALGEQIHRDPLLARRTLDWLAILGGATIAIIATACLWQSAPRGRSTRSGRTECESADPSPISSAADPASETVARPPAALPPPSLAAAAPPFVYSGAAAQR